MGRKANRKRQRRRPEQTSGRYAAPTVVRVGGIDMLGGAPVYDGTLAEVVYAWQGPQIVDARVYLGVGPFDEPPVAWVELCPCDGVSGLVQDLQRLAAIAGEYHAFHADPGSGETVRP